VERFLSLLPAGGRVLDAACGTGKYFGMVVDSERSLLGVDHSSGHLARAREKFPDVPTEVRELQELPYRGEFDGVLCVDALEMIPPEDYPGILEGFRRALRPGGRLYVTIERVPEDHVRRGTEEARRSGLPAVDGEVIWEDDLYHHYPSMDRVRGWLNEAGFAVDRDLEGPWDTEDEYAYHHLLAHAARRMGRPSAG
jgi:SAM-dependent methyltransferase